MIALLAVLLGAPADPLPLELSLRAGYARAVGTLERHSDLGAPDPFNNLLPLAVEIRYRVYQFVSLATSFEIAPALSCRDQRCNATSFRVGLGLHVQPREGEWRPFAALGLGYEWLRRSQHTIVTDAGGMAADVEEARTDQGVAFVIAQLGVERELSASLRLGPYAQLSLGSYSKEDIELKPPVQPVTGVAPGGTHGFAQLGLRLSFEP